MLRFVALFIATLSTSLFAEQPAPRPRAWFLADGRDVESVLATADPAKDGVRVALKTPDGKTPDAILSAEDGHSLRYLAKVRLADGREFREWHFDKLPKELADFPATVRGAFIRTVCEDRQFATACVELLLDDYTRRYFPLKAMRDDDRALAEKIQAEHDAKNPAKDTTLYPTKYGAYTPERDAAVCNFKETEHFHFHWGNEQAGSGKDWWKDDRQALTFAWFERVSRHFAAAGAQMPMAAGTPNEAKRAKIPVLITGTGTCPVWAYKVPET